MQPECPLGTGRSPQCGGGAPDTLAGKATENLVDGAQQSLRGKMHGADTPSVVWTTPKRTQKGSDCREDTATWESNGWTRPSKNKC